MRRVPTLVYTCARRIMRVGVVPAFLLFGALNTTEAGSATWKTTAVSGNWNSTSNWTPTTIPNGPLDVASFGTSNRTAIAFAADTEVNALMFNAGASAYTITAGGTGANFTFTISGAGIANNSTALQNFFSGTDENSNPAHIIFTNSATAGSNTRYVTSGGSTEFHNTSTAGSAVLISRLGGATFSNSSTAGNAMITNEGSADSFFSGGFTNFEDSATAGNAIVVNNSAQSGGFDGGHMQFNGMSNAGSATFTNKGGTFSQAGAGNIGFDFNSSASNANFTNEGASAGTFAGGGFLGFSFDPTAASSTITNNGGTTTDARGGRTEFFSASTAGASVITANGGTGGGQGARILFQSSSTGGTSQIRVFGNGSLEINAHDAPGVSIGSFEGTGNVLIGARILTLGINNMSTAFSGFIDDSGMGGGFTKTGTGVLSLGNGANNMINNGIADTVSLSIASASTIDLNYTGPPDKIRSLILAGVSQPPGVYGSAASGAPHQTSQFSGPGTVQVMMQAVSRKIHGPGTFDLDLPILGVPHVECRSAGASNSYQVIATFFNAVTFSSASVTSGNGMVSSATGTGTTVITVNLTGVTNAQTITVKLSGVNDGAGAHDITIPMSILIGDTTGNGTVTSSDVSQVKLQSGQSVTNSNFRADLNASGTITSTDVSAVKLKTGSALP